MSPAKKRASRSTSGPPVRTGAKAMVEQLQHLGVEVAFGIPGVHNLAIFDALRDSGIRVIVPRHEQTCVYAADGYARATGRLAVAITTTGPGAANTAAAMGEAKASRSPLLHISTQVASKIIENRSGRFSLHESPHQRAILDPLSVWSGAVARPDAIGSLISTAAVAAFSVRRGPAFLEVSHDFLDGTVSEPMRGRSVPSPLPPSDVDVQRALTELQRAKKPIIWAGGGAISSAASEQVRALAEALDAPVVTTFAGKGIIDPSHPLAVGLPPHEPAVTDLLRDGDLLIVIGSDLDGMNTQAWRLPLPRRRIAINTIAEDGRRNYGCSVVVEADAASTCQALVDALPVRKKRKSDGSARVAAARRKAIRSLKTKKDTKEGFGLVASLTAALPKDAFVAADMAVAGYWMAGYWQAPAPRSFAYSGWGTLGSALPLAVGAASTGRPTIAVVGDAGAMFCIGELATIAQESLPVCILVVDDGGYGMLRVDEQIRFASTFNVDLHAPDFVALAKSFGVKARKADLKSLDAAIAWGVAQKGPALIHVKASFAPPVTTSPLWPLRDEPEARP